MKNKISVFSALLALTIGPIGINAQTLTGHIVGITDGDTVTLLDTTNKQYKIRLSGIDAPEKAQPYGQVSKKSLSDLVYDKDVSVDYSKYDRYGRVIGKIIHNKVDVNLEQIKRGLAWHYKKYQKEQIFSDQDLYSEEEVRARNSKLGLWQEPNAISPWDWRRK
jgi:endonuclease YncB( thermonuclease family)